MTTVAVIQSNYIPWKGYFDIIHDVDVFIFYDDLQFTKNDWRNRNKIKVPAGSGWLTIPVGPATSRLICEVDIPNAGWQGKHWMALQQVYGKCRYFDRYRGFFEEVYRGRSWRNLSELNQYLIRTISEDFLRIDAVFRDSREYQLRGKKLDRLIDLLVQVGASRYVSGPSAKEYVDPSRFSEADIELLWKDYSGYPEYPQPFAPFTHAVSIVDLLFNVGPDAPWYIWGWRGGPLGPSSECQTVLGSTNETR